MYCSRLTFTTSLVCVCCIWRVWYAHAGSGHGSGSVTPIARRCRVTQLAIWPPPNVNQDVGAEHLDFASQGPKKSISASRSIHAPLAPLPDPESIAGRHEMSRTKQRGIDIPICGGGVHSHPAWRREQTQLRPKTISWYTTCVSYACRIPGRSRWGSSERASSLALILL